jgi:thiol-disulfide isomerase/thioredoxin
MSKSLLGAVILLSFAVGFFSHYYSKKNTKTFDAIAIKDITTLPFTSLENKPLFLNEFQFHDKLIINFWATWCEPCKEELPELNNLHKQLTNNQEIKIIGVAIDEADAVSEFIKKIPVNYPILVSEPNGFKLGKQLGNDKGVLPYTVIVDTSYNVLNKFYGKIKLEDLTKVIKSD